MPRRPCKGQRRCQCPTSIRLQFSPGADRAIDEHGIGARDLSAPLDLGARQDTPVRGVHLAKMQRKNWGPRELSGTLDLVPRQVTPV